MAQMAIKNEANTFTQINTFQNKLLAAGPTAATQPQYSFTAQPSTGVFLNASNQLAFAHAGIQVATMASTNFDSTLIRRGPDGSALAPAFSFTAQPGTGMYRPGTSLGFTVNGVDAMFLLNSEMRMIVDGTASVPSYSWQNRNAGMYASAGDRINWATAGIQRAFLDVSQFQLKVPLTAIDGTVGAPGYTFATDLATGFYKTVNGLTAVTAGVDLWAMSTNGMFVGVGFVIHANGDLTAATKPGFSFNNDPDSGFYRAAANSVSVAAGGETVLNFDFGTKAMWAGAGYAIRGDPARVAAQPAFSFTNDTDTGMFRRATNAIGFASGGVEIFNIGSGGIGVISGKLCFLNLPTSAGTSGSLWNNGGAVRVA